MKKRNQRRNQAVSGVSFVKWVGGVDGVPMGLQEIPISRTEIDFSIGLIWGTFCTWRMSRRVCVILVHGDLGAF